VVDELAPWLDASRAAEYAGVSATTVLRAARRGALRGYKVGSLWRFRAVDIDAWIIASRTPMPVRRSA
jgi:excisionase family DNA binding protein